MQRVVLISEQILIHDLGNPKVVGEFILVMNECIEKGYKRVRLTINESTSIYPNTACPLAGIMQFYKAKGIKFNIDESDNRIKSVHLVSPKLVSNGKNKLHSNVLNKVWKFKNEEDVFNLSKAFIEELIKIDTFGQGVLHSLEWSLYEIMDNVINHSETDSGFIMGQIHQKSKHIALCVFDAGQGIFNSLQSYKPKPKSPLDALTLCIKPGVTRGYGQGNGLFGLYEVILQNEGRFTISSGGATLTLNNNDIQTSKDHPIISESLGCTSVDFQLNYNNPVSLDKALKTNGKAYQPLTNYLIDGLENDLGEIVFLLKDKSSGFGTRKAGQKMRNEIINIHQETGQPVVIDFSGIALVASSFADEFLGKLVLELGFFGFNSAIRLRNMSELTQSIVQKSVSQRMAESLK
jgi:hypothetical protein